MSPTLVNLVEDHGFISEKYYLHTGMMPFELDMMPFEEAQSKAMRAYTQSGSKWIIPYHCGES